MGETAQRLTMEKLIDKVSEDTSGSRSDPLTREEVEAIVIMTVTRLQEANYDLSELTR